MRGTENRDDDALAMRACSISYLACWSCYAISEDAQESKEWTFLKTMEQNHLQGWALLPPLLATPSSIEGMLQAILANTDDKGRNLNGLRWSSQANGLTH